VLTAHAIKQVPAELDEISLRRAQRGDENAFRILIERYQRPVFDLLYRMLNRTHAQDRVEDLTQDTFVRVYSALERFNPAGSARLSTWILTIATRLALNELRKTRRTTVPLATVETLSTAANGEDALARRQVGDALIAAVANLDEKHRAVVILREYHGFEYGDIATTLDINVNTVKSRLARARQSLRLALREVYDA
jgi:RNA polymerase sigma-70 factor (ECF subfamily)